MGARHNRTSTARRAVAVCALGVVMTGSVAAIVSRRLPENLASVPVAVLLGLPSLCLAWWALRRDDDELAFTGSLPDKAQQLAREVHNHWVMERRHRGLEDPAPMPLPLTRASQHLVPEMTPPVDLTDGSEHPADLYERIPTRRLVVLGDGGSGKSVFLIRLVIDLAAKGRQGDSPVPFLVSLATWNPSLPLRDWLVDELTSSFRTLTQPIELGADRVTCAEALLLDHSLILVLDGLDEVPAEHRRSVFERLDNELGADLGVVVACRTDAYADLVHGVPGNPMMLKGAAGVVLGRPDPTTVERYLAHRADGTVAAVQRWQPVIDRLGTSDTLGLALRSPLLISLTNAVYNPRRSWHLSALRPPSELVALGSVEAIERHLLDQVVTAAYHPSDARHHRCRWERDPERVRAWFCYLASVMSVHPGPVPDRAYWYLEERVPRPIIGALVALCTAVFTGVPTGVLASVYTGAGGALATAAVAGAVAGVVTGTLAASGTAHSPGWSAPLFAFLGAPGRMLADAIGIRAPAGAARYWLALRGKLPWHLPQFLHDAHEHHGMLRRVGKAYEFRHRSVQLRLAEGVNS
ncbi:NACHT domain-containing protein [Streptomyces sp. NPDC050523]|uniref:NACHT domain-containing protein n=1 Tax=Streptomyces sp. NPDC050523 TaxID=3365622 RepID=UPI00378AB046